MFNLDFDDFLGYSAHQEQIEDVITELVYLGRTIEEDVLATINTIDYLSQSEVEYIAKEVMRRLYLE